MLLEVKQLKQLNGWHLDRGLQRENNEDYLCITKISKANHSKDDFIGVYALADGMGGLAHGERASHRAVSAATQSIVKQALNKIKQPEDCREWLQTAVHSAHSIQCKANATEPYCESGTTLVIALIHGNWLHVSNVGDSRAYIISQNRIRQISQDHSLAAMLVEAGEISQEDMLKSQYRNTLTQAIGLDMDIEPSLVTEQLYAGDYLLLCSDGLYSQVDEDEIVQIIQSAVSVQLACEALVNAANAAGGEDNVAVILVQIQESA
jgi:serine/threonine protein phosphatase PrpC